MPKRIAVLLTFALVCTFAAAFSAAAFTDNTVTSAAPPATMTSAVDANAPLFELEALLGQSDVTLGATSKELSPCFQCHKDCQAYSEPTRSQCSSWCHNNVCSNN